MRGGILGHLPTPDEEEELFQRGYVVGLGLVIPTLMQESDLIVKRNLGADEYIAPGSDAVH